jgi:hypothetical protein
MEVNLSAEILERANDCNKQFSCLQKKTREVCEVERLVLDRTLFVKSENNRHCPYFTSFGYSYAICNCYVRRELYIRYGI